MKEQPARRTSPAIAAASAVAMGLFAALSGTRPGLAADLRPAEAPFVRAVTVAKVNRTCFAETLPVTGTVVARNEVLVRPDRDGLGLSEVLVEPGDTVSSGQVLARLKPLDGQRNAASVGVQAPVAGVVFGAFGIIGAPVSPGGEPLFRIARQGELELVADAPVASMARLAPDQPAKVEVIGIGEVAGKVRLISSAVNPMTQLGQVTVVLGSDSRIRVGVFGRATIELARRCGPALPVSAVVYGTGGAIVQVVRNDRVETRAVTVGQIKGDEVEIRQGVSEGETVVARAGAFVRDGDEILPVRAPASPCRGPKPCT